MFQGWDFQIKTEMKKNNFKKIKQLVSLKYCKKVKVGQKKNLIRQRKEKVKHGKRERKKKTNSTCDYIKIKLFP